MAGLGDEDGEGRPNYAVVLTTRLEGVLIVSNFALFKNSSSAQNALQFHYEMSIG